MTPSFTASHPVGIIDIGSNSVRLVIYDGHTRVPVTLFNEKAICELGRGLEATGKLSPKRVEAALENLARFRAILDKMGVKERRILATAAIRLAKNGKAFAKQAEKALGQPIEIIAGDEEARLSALGVVSVFDHASGIVGDLGGGSLELADVNNHRILKRTSLFIGHQRLIDIFDKQGLDAVAQTIDTEVGAIKWLKKLKGQDFYAVGGAWRQLAEVHMALVHYPIRLINGYTLDHREAATFFLSHQPPPGKPDKNGLAPLRRPANTTRNGKMLAVAALIMGVILHHGQPGRIVFSGNGLREGCMFDMLPKALRGEDPLLASSRYFAEKTGSLPPNVGELIAFVANTFAHCPAQLQRLYHSACLLSDIAFVEARDYRSRNAFERILTLPITGLSHPERLFLALAIHARYAGHLQGEHLAPFLPYLPAHQQLNALALGQVLRLAQTVAASQPGILPGKRLVFQGHQLRLACAKGSPFVQGDRVERYLSMLGQTFNLPVALG